MGWPLRWSRDGAALLRPSGGRERATRTDNDCLRAPAHSATHQARGTGDNLRSQAQHQTFVPRTRASFLAPELRSSARCGASLRTVPGRLTSIELRSGIGWKPPTTQEQCPSFVVQSQRVPERRLSFSPLASQVTGSHNHPTGSSCHWSPGHSLPAPIKRVAQGTISVRKLTSIELRSAIGWKPQPPKSSARAL